MSRSHRKGPLPPRQAPVTNHGRTLSEAGRLIAEGNYLESAKKFAEAAHQYPKSAIPRINEGVSYLRAGLLDKAEVAFQQAALIEPKHPDLLKNLAVMFMYQQRNEEAVAAFQQVLALDYGASPMEIASLWNNLGASLRRLKRLEESVECFRSAIELHPFVDPFKNLSIALEDLWRSSEALATLKQGLALFPQAGDLLLQMGSLYLNMSQAQEAVAILNQVPQHNSANKVATLIYQLVSLQYAGVPNPMTLKQVASTIDQLRSESLPSTPQPYTNKRSADRPLRVGYVSGDFRHHPVAFFITPVIQNHNPSRVQSVCYFNHIHEDHWTNKIKSRCFAWRQVALMSDDKFEAQIRDDQIDILVDLSGYASYNRLTLFTRKPAPVQVTWAGWPGTTGMKAIDWLIADRFHIAANAEEEACYTESIFRMPHGYVPYQVADDTPNFSALPYRRNKYITFGFYDNISKLNRAVIAAWSQILVALPTSRLLLRNKRLADPNIQRYLSTLFQQHGVTTQRVQFLGELEHLAMMASYSEVDVVLDTFPYSGHTTTLEALWMGVPVITLTGSTFAGRHSTSHLTNIGHANLVTRSVEQYVQLAIDLGHNPDQIEALRHFLRADMKKSHLLRHTDFTRTLEEGYQMMWARWLEKSATDPNAPETLQHAS
ncbi:MAG: tetratricopeptide repeat protein [Magnetococcales bacterium]|nr:tetratricopeptide repeat protein [Magnetococcales bacterium]